MLIIPAIDLKDGFVVRLYQGEFKDSKVYSRDAVRVAKHWVKQGAQLLHIVDLDGASTGIPKNLSILNDIIKAIDCPIEFGGGIRDIKTIKMLLGLGVFRVVLGTRAIEDEKFLKNVAQEFKDRVIVSLDVKNNRLATQGWKKTGGLPKLEDFILRLKNLNFSRIIYTDTLKDGTLKGPNIKEIKAILKSSKLKLIVSGGISSLLDIRRLSFLGKKGLEGVIIGKALYEGRFTLAEALKIAG